MHRVVNTHVTLLEIRMEQTEHPFSFPSAAIVSTMRPELLKRYVVHNTAYVMRRLRDASPCLEPQSTAHLLQRLEAGGQLSNVFAGASALTERAMSPKNLCRMEPAWHPWM